MAILKSAVDLKHARQIRTLTVAPKVFSGSLAELYTRFIEPNLPSPETVSAFHAVLADYCKSSDPLFLLRKIAGTERGAEYVTNDGTRFKATDNAPAWWTQFAAFQQHELSPDKIGEIIASMPSHMFEVAKTQPRSANSAGWHIAHILPVKDGDTLFRQWTRTDATRRFMRNVHPCNYFLVPKGDWQRWGGDRRVIGAFSRLYATRYEDVWHDFLSLTDGGAPDEPWVDASAIDIEIGVPRLHDDDGEAAESAISLHVRADCAEYASTRLTFKANVIEPLPDDGCFRVITPTATFEFTKASFYAAFPGVVKSESYRVRRVYHYPFLPTAAVAFRIST